jgi:uncharacterized protein YbaA (DUF1428 family)
MATKSKGSYVDGYVIPIAKKNVAAYRKMAALGKKMWMKHGALDYKECVLEDSKVKGVASFTKLAKTKPGETVIFSYIVFKSRKHRDQVNAKVMKDPEMKGPDPNDTNKMPFDMKRMVYSGFEVIV